jgi:hypothetical protein
MGVPPTHICLWESCSQLPPTQCWSHPEGHLSLPLQAMEKEVAPAREVWEG